jgi:threonine dehydratase
MRFAFSKMKLVIEPGGAVALAALLAGIAPPADQDGDTVVVISGSNVDPIFYAEIVAGR